MRALIALLGFIATPALAQVTYPPSVTPDALQAAIAAASPAGCPIPLPDTLTGSAGGSALCMARADATRPTVIQAKDTATAADASWSISWDRAFSAPPTWTDARIYGAADPYLCTITTSTTTGANGKCYKLVATTLPSVLTAVAGTVVSPITAAGGGLSVRVAARQ